MTEEQAKQWLIGNGFYTEYDKLSGETYLSEAAISVDDEHVDIVIKLTEVKEPTTPIATKRIISLEAYLKMQAQLISQVAPSGREGEYWPEWAKKKIDALLKFNNVMVKE